MLVDQFADLREFRCFRLLKVDHIAVAPFSERTLGIVHVGHATAHACRKIQANFTEHEDGATRHVFAAVVAHTLDHQRRTRVAHCEPLPREPVHEPATARRTIEGNVAGNDVLLRPERCLARR